MQQIFLMLVGVWEPFARENPLIYVEEMMMTSSLS